LALNPRINFEIYFVQASSMYSTALELAREERFEAARLAFEEVIAACPGWQKPWVSYAQMEKRAAAQSSEHRWSKCREVLQRALVLNPESVQVIQAWGLMELQRGNLVPAVRLLERCVSFDPVRCEPVLRWKPVAEARKTVSSRKEQRQE
jgi:predicted Zn-dependent protease